MNTTTLSDKKFTIPYNPDASQLRRVFVSRLDATMKAFMSPIERWPDNNYVPKTLDYAWKHSPDFHEIIAPTHGFDSRDVRVDLSRGYVIILLSRDYGAASLIDEEYYCEVPLPVDSKRNEAYLEIGANFLIVRLNKRGTLLEQIVSAVLRRFNFTAVKL